MIARRAIAADGTRARADALSVVILYAPLVGVTVLAKLAFTLGGTQILFAVPLIIAAAAFGWASRRLTFEPLRLALYLATAAIVCAEQALAVSAFSLSSVLLLLALHLPYTLRLRAAGDWLAHVRRVLDLIWALCLLGIAQYAAQFVMGTAYAYPIEHFAPAAWVDHHYNGLNPLSYGSSTYKTNGVFLLEPSFFSQLVAVGFAIEASTLRRVHRLACFCAGLVVAFSGTGLLLMTVIAAVLVALQRRADVGLLLVAIAAALLLLGDRLGLGLFADRMGEFSSSGSSGYSRYVGGFLLFDQYLWDQPQRWLFGLGAGMMLSTTPAPMYSVVETGWVKLIAELGLVGAGAYFLFLYTSVAWVRQPLVLRVCLIAMTLLNGILDPWVHGLLLTLAIWAPEQAGRAAPQRSSAPRAAGAAIELPRIVEVELRQGMGSA